MSDNEQSSPQIPEHSRPSPRRTRKDGPARLVETNPNQLIRDINKNKRKILQAADHLKRLNLEGFTARTGQSTSPRARSSSLGSSQDLSQPAVNPFRTLHLRTSEPEANTESSSESDYESVEEDEEKLETKLHRPRIGSASADLKTCRINSTGSSSSLNNMGTPVVNNYVSLYVPPAVQVPFDGTTDVKEFLDKYESLAKAYSWTDEVKVANFGLHIDGAVKDFFKLLKATTAATQKVTEDQVKIKWADLRKSFKEAFSSKTTKEEYTRQLEARKYKTNENAETYFWAVLRLCSKVDTAMKENREKERERLRLE